MASTPDGWIGPARIVVSIVSAPRVDMRRLIRSLDFRRRLERQPQIDGPVSASSGGRGGGGALGGGRRGVVEGEQGVRGGGMLLGSDVGTGIDDCGRGARRWYDFIRMVRRPERC